LVRNIVETFKGFWCSANKTVFCRAFECVLIQFGTVFIVAREGYEYKCSCVGGGDDNDRNFYQSNESEVLNVTLTPLRTSYSVVNS
jgi:hypothetical protein